jgi:hypothetical protein
MSHYHKVVLVKEAEDAINVATHLNSDFINSICVLKMLEIDFRNSVNALYNLKCPKNFLLNLPRQAVVELPEIISIEKEFAFFVHRAKVEKVVQLDNLKFEDVCGSITGNVEYLRWKGI